MTLSKERLERGHKVAIIRLLTIKMHANSTCTGISLATSADPVEESVQGKENRANDESVNAVNSKDL